MNLQPPAPKAGALPLELHPDASAALSYTLRSSVEVVSSSWPILYRCGAHGSIGAGTGQPSRRNPPAASRPIFWKIPPTPFFCKRAYPPFTDGHELFTDFWGMWISQPDPTGLVACQQKRGVYPLFFSHQFCGVAKRQHTPVLSGRGTVRDCAWRGAHAPTTRQSRDSTRGARDCGAQPRSRQQTAERPPAARLTGVTPTVVGSR